MACRDFLIRHHALRTTNQNGGDHGQNDAYISITEGRAGRLLSLLLQPLHFVFEFVYVPLQIEEGGRLWRRRAVSQLIGYAFQVGEDNGSVYNFEHGVLEVSGFKLRGATRLGREEFFLILAPRHAPAITYQNSNVLICRGRAGRTCLLSV
jgi:hypothetical protein